MKCFQELYMIGPLQLQKLASHTQEFDAFAYFSTQSRLGVCSYITHIQAASRSRLKPLPLAFKSFVI